MIDEDKDEGIGVTELAAFISHHRPDAHPADGSEEKPLAVWPGAQEMFFFDRPEECVHIMEVTKDQAGHTIRRPFDFASEPMVGSRLIVLSGVMTPHGAPEAVSWSDDPVYRGSSVAVSCVGAKVGQFGQGLRVWVLSLSQFSFPPPSVYTVKSIKKKNLHVSLWFPGRSR